MHARTSSSKIHSLGFRIVHPCDAYNDAEVFKQITPLLPFGADNGGISPLDHSKGSSSESQHKGNPSNMPSDTKNSKPLPRLKYFRRWAMVSHGEPWWAMVSPINAIFSYPKKRSDPAGSTTGLPGLPALQPWKHFVPVKEDFSSSEISGMSGTNQYGWGVSFERLNPSCDSTWDALLTNNLS